VPVAPFWSAFACIFSTVMNMNYAGAAAIDCDAPVSKGDELGWFEHG
jgi:hypothetical protein